MVNCPELLMRSVLAQIHYMPDTWKGNAHTYRVRDEFSMLFQYKAVSCGVYNSNLIANLIIYFSIFVTENLKNMFWVSLGLSYRRTFKSLDNTIHAYVQNSSQVVGDCGFLQKLYSGSNGSWRCVFICADGCSSPWQPYGIYENITFKYFLNSNNSWTSKSQ